VPHSILRSLAAEGPMLPTLVDGLPDRAGWMFEPKWDGWRCLAIIDHVVEQTKSGIDLTIVASGPLNGELLHNRLMDALRTAGLHDPSVRIGLVDRLPRNQQSSKLKRFVPLQG
jgi:hypothetical protein